ncbi:twin-arginine translocase TatA/TatE family subunit [Solidesulfovibrio sp. C21]|uniref:twin-arginine translocase TatA/TatE family subunit n=1 Tax=Solidesulfovibrio sp. C21 TaxID=3398613 RepID=UPI0039FDA473
MFAGLFEPIHLLLILGVVLIIFGPGKLANVGHDLGKAVRDFRSAMEARDVTPQVAAAKPAAGHVEQGDAGGETLCNR